MSTIELVDAPDWIRPRYLSIPDYDERYSFGDEVVDLASSAGFVADPEQAVPLRAGFAFDPRTRKSIAFTVVLVAPRQNLKTGAFKIAALGHLYVTAELGKVLGKADDTPISWTAHEFATSQKSAEQIETIIDNCDWLRRQVRLTNRRQVMKHGANPSLTLKSGSSIIFGTRTSGAGRGLSGRKVFADEAYALQSAQVGAAWPTLIAQPDPQLWLASSACRPESAYLSGQVKRGRASAEAQARGEPGEQRMIYVEYCAPPPAEVCAAGVECTHEPGTPGCGCDDLDVIRGFQTAITRGRILVSTLVDLRPNMPAREYAREVMGWHDAVIDDDPRMIPFTVEQWQRWDVNDRAIVPSAPASFGIAADPDFAATSITACSRVGRGDVVPEHLRGRKYLEHVAGFDGTTGVIERCVELKSAHGGRVVFALDSQGPANTLTEKLRAAGCTVETMNTADAINATAETVAAVTKEPGGLPHWPQDEMDAAVERARKRFIGKRGYVVDRADPDDNVTPLQAGIAAWWGAERGGGPNVW